MRRRMRGKKVSKEMEGVGLNSMERSVHFFAGDPRGPASWILEALIHRIKIEAELVVNRRFDFCGVDRLDLQTLDFLLAWQMSGMLTQ